MTNSRNFRGTFTSKLLVSAASIALLSGMAMAQDADTDDTDELMVEEVVVTGSRIKRTGLDTIRPSISVSAEIFDQRAFTNIADALNEIPVFGAGVSPDGAQNGFTVGQNYVNLFGLGTQRTLTLVNGRRFVSSNVPTIFGSAGGLQVDMNAIPVALLERVEIVPLAGSAVYGSDAIGGVVNVILRDDYEGFEVSGQHGFSQAGGGANYQLQSTFGTNFADDRGNVTFSVEYNKQAGMMLTERPYYTDDNPGFLNYGGLDLDGDGEDDDVDGDDNPDTFQRFTGERLLQAFSGGGSVSATGDLFRPSYGGGQMEDGNYYQFNQNGELETCVAGDTPAGSSFYAYNGTCGMDFFDGIEQIQSDLERIVATSIAHYQINDYIRYNQEFMFANSKATELANQGGFQSWAFGGTSGSLTMSTDNPFLSDQARGILEGNGLTEFNLDRFNNDLVSAGQDSTENFTWRYAGGFEGDFSVGNRDFYWDVSAVFGQADVETRGLGIIDGRFLNAIDAVTLDEEILSGLVDLTYDADGDGDIDIDDAFLDIQKWGGSGVTDLQMGDIVCQVSIDTAMLTLEGYNENASGNGVTDGDLPFSDGCVPLNLFGEGVASAEALAFINGGPAITSSNIGQRVFSAHIGGDIVDLPGGTVAFVSGFENRRETASFTPGLGTSIAITRSSPFDPTVGSSSTSEFYTEVLVPLISPEMDIPFMRFAEFEGSVRRVKNTINGPDDYQSSSVDYTYEMGARFSPVEDVILRATYASAIRSPSLVELFSPQVQSFISGTDPCDARAINNGPDPDTRRTNCALAGITDPDSFTSGIMNATIIGASGGNPELTAERSKSFSIGMVLEPRWVPRLSVAIDYVNVKIEDRIENFGWEELAETCYDSTDYPNVACDSFTRDADGQVTYVLSSYLNAANSTFEAVQMAARYDFGLSDALSIFDSAWGDTDLGHVFLSSNFMFNIDKRTQVVPTREADQTVGGWSAPNVTGYVDASWEKDAFRWFYRVSFKDSALLDTTGNGSYYLDEDDNIISTTRARWMHSTSFSYTVLEGTTLQLSIDNLMNRKADEYELATGRYGLSDLLGRQFTVRVRSMF